MDEQQIQLLKLILVQLERQGEQQKQTNEWLRLLVYREAPKAEGKK